MPHDLGKQWRWVDAQHQKHPWVTSQSVERAQQHSVPPVEPPCGWPSGSSEWEVVQPPGLCDAGGWQYAVDFYVADSLWGESSSLFHCRRRLWRRTFPSDASASASHVASPTNATRSRQQDQPAATQSGMQPPTLVKVASERVHGLDLQLEAERLLAEEWRSGCLVLDLLEAAGADGIEVKPWRAAPGAGQDARRAFREAAVASLPVPTKGPMVPKTTRSNYGYEVQVSGKDQVKSVCIDMTVSLLDTPYCDCMVVTERFLLEAAEDGEGVVASKFCGLTWVKRTMLQSTIEAANAKQQQKNGELFIDLLRRRASPTSPEPSVTVVEVWELQRRFSMFHQTWQAPFLPHDGDKRCRWVDARFRRHPWGRRTTAVSAALASRPPLCPPGGWPEKSERWSVVLTPGGPCDEGGWQYSFDFLEDPAVWGAQAEFAACRRRLWRCSVPESTEAESVLPECEDQQEQPDSAAVRWHMAVWAVLVTLLIALLALGRQSAGGLPVLTDGFGDLDSARAGLISWSHGLVVFLSS